MSAQSLANTYFFLFQAVVHYMYCRYHDTRSFHIFILNWQFENEFIHDLHVRISVFHTQLNRIDRTVTGFMYLYVIALIAIRERELLPIAEILLPCNNLLLSYHCTFFLSFLLWMSCHFSEMVAIARTFNKYVGEKKRTRTELSNEANDEFLF